MKIQSISLKNFAGLQEFSANISPGVTYLVGSNGTGKTTVGHNSIWFILKGIAEKGDVLKGKRFMFIGPDGPEAEGVITMKDADGETYEISRKINENNKQELTIVSSSGRSLDQKWINTFWNDLMLSPLSFSRLSGKEQADMLGIDISSFQDRENELKDQAKIIRHDIKSFGEVELPDEVPETVDVSELIAEKNKIIEFNNQCDEQDREFQARLNKIASQEREALEIRGEIARLTARLNYLESSISQEKHTIENSEPIQAKIPTDDIDAKIASAGEINAAAMRYQEMVEKAQKKIAREADLERNLGEQKANQEAKIQYVQGLDLPFANLTIDDNGGLLMEGRPICVPHFSHAELIRICSNIMAVKSPDFKYVYIEDFSVMDQEKGQAVVNDLLEQGFQVVCEKVSPTKTDGVVVLTEI